MSKVCSKCGQKKPIEEFYRDRSCKSGRRSWCKKCCNKAHNEYDKLHRYEYRERYNEGCRNRYKGNKKRERNRTLKKRYGITLEQYEILSESQNDCCAICKKHQSELKQALDVDHDHITNRVRGLLCRKCNILLGQLERIEKTRFISKADLYRGK